jgi:lysophospholipase L1-like esterase
VGVVDIRIFDAIPQFGDFRNNTTTQIKCSAGAKLSDMKHYSIPPLTTDPKHVILHCGTNDLQTKSQQEITKETGELCDSILAISPNTDITVSSILTRKDNQGNKIAEVNDQLRLLCLEKNFKFLLHANIDNKCLNRSGLHLNKLGDSIFAKNIIGAIKCFSLKSDRLQNCSTPENGLTPANAPEYCCCDTNNLILNDAFSQNELRT